MKGDASQPKRRREDNAATDFDTYVQDVITRLDGVIFRLIEDADVFRQHSSANVADQVPDDQKPAAS